MAQAGTELSRSERQRLLDAIKSYEEENPYYDETFDEVSTRIRSAGSAGKLGISALLFWKRIRTEKVAERLLNWTEGDVRAVTSKAFSPGWLDGERLYALSALPGFRRRGAIASTLLAAWDPENFAVYDQNAARGLRLRPVKWLTLTTVTLAF